MKKLLIIFSILCAMVVFASRVRTGAISDVILWSYSGGINSTSTNKLIGYLPPKSSPISIDLIIGAGFNATTNNLMNVVAIDASITNGVLWTRTNTLLASVNVSTNSAIATAHSAITNGFMILSTNRSVPVYAYFTENGATAVTAGYARIVVNYIQH